MMFVLLCQSMFKDIQSEIWQPVTSAQPWPRYERTRLCSDSRPAAALFLEQEVCEMSIRPHYRCVLASKQRALEERNGRSDAWFFLLNADVSV